MNQTMITLQQIFDAEICAEDGWHKVLNANGGTRADYDAPFPMSSILDSNDLEDTLWLLRCLPAESQLWRRFAWWCASSVVHLTTNKAAQSKLDVIDAYIKGDATDEQLKSVSYAARAGTDAARAAARAISHAARDETDMALAAARAARAARDATSDFRDATDASQLETLRQLLDHGTYPAPKQSACNYLNAVL